MMWMLLDAAVFAAGYAASIYSWPRIKLWINGAESEIANLEAEAAAIKAAVAKTATVKGTAVKTAAAETAVAKTAAATTPVATTSATTAPVSKAAP